MNEHGALSRDELSERLSAALAALAEAAKEHTDLRAKLAARDQTIDALRDELASRPAPADVEPLRGALNLRERARAMLLCDHSEAIMRGHTARAELLSIAREALR